MIPSRLVRIDALPLTPNGKVDRNALPEPGASESAVRSVAARNEIERKLVAIWESVFEVRPIGIEDNFFDLGGHSLLVAKILRKIEVEFGARLSMAAVFEAPTILRLAELLADKSWSTRVPRITNLQPAGALEPLFWIHGGPKTRALAAGLGTHRPFLGVGIEYREDEEISRWGFAEFAARLVRTIRAAQPHGPYYLGGWCVAGLLAYEVASQLIEAGEEVAQVVMLDAVNPAHYCGISKYRMLASKAAYHMRQMLRADLGEVLANAGARWKGFLGQLFERQPVQANPVDVATTAAAMIYRPPMIGVRVLAIQPAERPDIRDLRTSWAAYLSQGNIQICDAPGNHLTMFQEPHVQTLASVIKSSLRNQAVKRRRFA
jgi:thioesterase domain-containing protein/acyl carrier protein